jgi:cell wall-associated NlpC family hydrolase
MTTRNDVIQKARTQLGTRFRHQGRSPVLGFDCIGLVVWTLTQLGLLHVDRTDYSRRPRVEEMTAALEGHLIRVPLDQIRHGDVLRFQAGVDGDPVHIGFATDRGVLHATAAQRAVVEHRLDTLWTAQLVEAYRIPGLEDT